MAKKLKSTEYEVKGNAGRSLQEFNKERADLWSKLNKSQKVHGYSCKYDLHPPACGFDEEIIEEQRKALNENGTYGIDSTDGETFWSRDDSS